MLRFVKQVVLGFTPEDVAETSVPVVIPDMDFEEVPVVLPSPPSRLAASFGEGFKKKGIVCCIERGMVTIICKVHKDEIGEIVVRPMREVRLSMY